MKGQFIYLVIANLFFIMSCEPANKIDRIELLQLERNGYSIKLDSVPIKLNLTYLNTSNIENVRIVKKTKQVYISRRNSTLPFYSIVDLRIKKNYLGQIDVITV